MIIHTNLNDDESSKEDAAATTTSFPLAESNCFRAESSIRSLAARSVCFLKTLLISRKLFAGLATDDYLKDQSRAAG